MKDMSLPIGIRKSPPLKDGTFTFEARINRQGVRFSRHWSTVKEASAWKTRTDALIQSGIDPRELEENKVRGHIIKTGPGPMAFPLRPPEIAVGDVAPLAQVGMTVEQAIDGYLAHRNTSHLKLKPNQITEYQRVRDDLGNLKIANLVNKDMVNYISHLLAAPRKRDDPSAVVERKKNVSPSPTLPLGAKGLANARYKAKIKAEKQPREPKPLAEATVRKYILAMKTAIQWQAKNHGVDYHKFLFQFDKRVMPAAWNGRRDRRLMPGEEERLYAAGIDRGGYTYTEHDWRMLLGFALETALRQQELAFAKWEDLQSDCSKLFIPKKNSKTKKDRYILLTPRAREIVELQKLASPKRGKRIFHQFPNAKAMCDSFMKLTARAGIYNLTFHDLRHEGTSRLCESGTMSLMEIMEMTGHDTMTTFKGYVKLIAHENSRRL
jgi:integrase